MIIKQFANVLFERDDFNFLTLDQWESQVVEKHKSEIKAKLPKAIYDNADMVV